MIQLNYRDSRPIYEQIRDGLKRLIITGAVGTDERLPSVRELASQLAIPIPLQKRLRNWNRKAIFTPLPGVAVLPQAARMWVQGGMRSC